MNSIIKMTLKILFRNKGLLFFLFVTPIVSLFILSIKTDDTTYGTESSDIIELSSCEERAVYEADTSTYIVKVYDASGSELSDYILRAMSKTGMFSVCRADAKALTAAEVRKQAEKDAFDDRAGTLLYLKENFDEAVCTGNWEDGMKIYEVSDDERVELFENEWKNSLEQIRTLHRTTGKKPEELCKILQKTASELPQKKTVQIAGGDELQLTGEQQNNKTRIGYAVAILGLGFMFCGVFAAQTVIEEQDTKVLTRLLLTKLTDSQYFLGKFVITVIIAIFQTAVLLIGVSVMHHMDFGIAKGTFFLLIFFLGLIFSALSFMMGIVVGNVMSSNYVTFAVWTISSLLSGLYFPLEKTTTALKMISYLMPQRWFMDIAAKFLTGDKTAYGMLFCVTAAYLIVIISIGTVALKVKRKQV